MKLEKKIEQAIIRYLQSLWAVVEGIQSGKVLISKHWYNHRMNLQSAWCPDIIALVKWVFLWIEVKKDQKEVGKWCKLLARYEAWEELPPSYERERRQIVYRQKILDNWGVHIITCDVWEVIDFITNL